MSKAAQKRNENIWEALNEGAFRVSKIVHFGSMLDDGDSLPEIIKDDFIWRIDEWAKSDLANDLPFLSRLAKEDPIEDWMFSEEIAEHRKFGFLIEAEFPKLSNFQADGYTVHNGNYRVLWFYGETYEDAFSKAKAYALKRIEDGKTEAVSA